jgi:hypothetical protein
VIDTKAWNRGDTVKIAANGIELSLWKIISENSSSNVGRFRDLETGREGEWAILQ